MGKTWMSNSLTGRQEKQGTIIQLSTVGRQTGDDNTVAHFIKSEKPSTVRHTINFCTAKTEKHLTTKAWRGAFLAHHIFILFLLKAI